MTDKILVIEENSTERESLALALQGAGYKVETAENLKEARSIFLCPVVDFVLVSTLHDAGVDLGYDVNGPTAGKFNGAAPDLGAWEFP